MWYVIEKILKEKDMNQESLSKKMNIGSGTLTNLKKGRIKKPSFELICKLADALDVSTDEFRKEND